MISCDIVIVNWNSGKQLRNCLQSISERGIYRDVSINVIVIDNGSQDGSAEIPNDYPFQVQILKNQENRGFGAACNQGASIGAADFILFLNPDTILSGQSLLPPLELMRLPEHEMTGVVGVTLTGSTGHVERGCCRLPDLKMFLSHAMGLDRLAPRRFPSHKMVEWDHLDSGYVDHVIGAFYLIRRTLFEQLNGFDERFFVYLEDLDLSCRVAASGYKTYYFAEASAFHQGGGVSEQIKDIRLFYAIRSRLQYAIKHFSRTEAFLTLLMVVTVEPLVRILYLVLKGGGQGVWATVRAFGLLYRQLPTLLGSLLFQQEKRI